MITSPYAPVNLTALIADVVLQYPAIKEFHYAGLSMHLLLLIIKCFTKVVEDGLNKCKKP
jgi:hypothetical protein